MKKLMAIILSLLTMATLFTGCKKEPDPIPVDTTNIMNYAYLDADDKLGQKLYFREGDVDNGEYTLMDGECVKDITYTFEIRGKTGYKFNNVTVTCLVEGWVENAYHSLGGCGSLEAYKDVYITKDVVLSEDGNATVEIVVPGFGSGKSIYNYICGADLESKFFNISGSVTPIEE